MTLARHPRRLPAALALGLSLGLTADSPAQYIQSGPGISSGSGAGTGTGMSAGSGLGTTGTGMESDASSLGGYGDGLGTPGGRLLPVPRGVINPGAGSRARLPTDILPPTGNIGGGLDSENLPELSPDQVSEIYRRQLDQVRTIGDPIQRAMALERIGRSAIFTSHLEFAHDALAEAQGVVLPVAEGLARDQRIMAIVTTLMGLAEAQVREALIEEYVFSDANTPIESGRKIEDRLAWLDRADAEWARASELATHLTNENFRSQMLYRVVESQANSSQLVANQVQRSSYSGTNLVAHAGPLNAASDRALVSASAHSRLIERPLWRDRALVVVASNAADSNQFGRGLQIARTIPQPEARTDALLRIAEAQARHNQDPAATSTYSEVAQAVAAIPQEDPREILAGVLIDSLVAVGRFDDARASVGLMPDPNNRMLALGAIAESQASRGRAGAARAWIDREAPTDLRSYLLRRVEEGVLASVDRSRTQTLLNQGR